MTDEADTLQPVWALTLCTIVHILRPMEYVWDPEKARSNRQKHGVSFADAIIVLEDEFALTIPDEHSYEDRRITIGEDALGKVLVVVYTYRGEDTIRIISARVATARERRIYREGTRDAN